MFGTNLKAARKAKGLTLEQLADIYNEKYDGGLSKGTLSKYENGKQTPMFTVVVHLADILDVTVDDLADDNTKQPSNITPIDPNTEFVSIPIVGSVAAGMGCIAEENIIGYEPMLKSDLKGGGDFTFLTVQGDSMYPEFKEGDLAFVRLQKSVDSGSYAVVIIDGQEGVIKRVVYGDDWIELRSINPMYPPRRFEGKDVTRVEVYGLVKDLKRKFN